MEIVEANGGFCVDTEKIICGGPMMGKTIANTNAYVAKGFTSLLQISEAEARRSLPENCIRCAKCVDACPMGLEPYLLDLLVENNRLEDAENEAVMTCIECGSCQFICPSSRPLLDYIRLGKNKVNKMIRARMQN